MTYPAFDLAASLLWAITPEYLEMILSIAARENMTPEAVAAQLGRPLANTRKVSQRDNVAVIPVEGPIFRRANMFSMISGNATSVQVLATDLKAALDDPAITQIVLNIDSPGGEANGIGEMAGMIRDANSVKPVTAYIGGMGASAAYWLASAAGRIVAHETALVGSIGVVAAMKQPNRNDLKFISSQSPNKHADPSTPRGATLVQDSVDKLAQQFIDAVALYRGVDAETVMKDFGAGSTKYGADAVAAKMADSLGTFEGTIAELVQASNADHTQLRIAAGDDQSGLIAGQPADEMAITATNNEAKDEDYMALSETMKKFVAGLSPDEKTEFLASMNGGGAETQTATPVQQPAAPVVAAPAVVDNTLMQRAVNAECNAFVVEMKNAGKVTPAEEANVRKMFTALGMGGSDDLLASYKASIEARPANTLLKETVPNNGTVNVLPNGTANPQAAADAEAAEISALLGATPEGVLAATALKAGQIRPDFKQFAVQ